MSANNLAYATPESLGIPSEAIEELLAQWETLRLPMHSFLLLRHGKIAAEGYWPPFHAEKKHRMYSISKSFTSVAVGMMIDQGKLKLTDKVADFFPEYLPQYPHPYVLEATVENLLMMSTYCDSLSYSLESPDFVAAFFEYQGPKHKPGALFMYDTAATNVLCGIVEKLAGMPMLDFMRPVLDKIGFSPDAWCVQSPEGRSWTGSGILCTPRDLARFALLCQNQGSWAGEQLISQEYMNAATSRRIDNSITHSKVGESHGYGYQFWMLREGGFGAFGMGSQLALCMPKYDAILITTADNQMTPGVDETIVHGFYRLLDKSSAQSLPENPQAQAILEKRIAALSLALPVGKTTTPAAADFSGRTYRLEKNPYNFQWMRLEITDGLCTLHYENATGVHALKLGMGHYEPQLFPEKYFGKRIGTRDMHYETVAAGAWASENTLIGTLYAVDSYVGTMKMHLNFTKSELCVFITKAAERFFDDYVGILSGFCND